MIKIPARPGGQWTVQYSSDKLPDVVATRNITFDKEGYLRLSKPTVSYYSAVDDADFGLPINYLQAYEGAWFVLTDKAQFTLDMAGSSTYGIVTTAQDTNTSTPTNTGSYFSDSALYDAYMVYVNPTDQKVYRQGGGSLINNWVVDDTSASIEDNAAMLTACNFVSNASFAIGNDNQVDLYNGSFAAQRACTLLNDFSVTGITYNNGLLGITTLHKGNAQRAMFYVWDGQTEAANYVSEVPATICYAPAAYRGSFVFLDANGILWYWTPSQLQVLAALPTYYTDATMFFGRDTGPRNHSIIVDGELIHINIRSRIFASTENDEYYLANQPGGIWTYDPAVGLYHRHATSGTKVVVDTIATSAVNTSTEVITVTSAPETGTPVRYSDGASTAIAGLVSGRLYYTIKTGSTTIKLASTYANALASTAINLTGTGNNAQTLQFYLKTDFGQSYSVSQQGAVYLDSRRGIGNEMYFQNIFYGAKVALDTTTENALGGYVLKDSENRGHFITSKFMSAQLQEDWQKLFIKHSVLSSTLDKIVVKYRTDANIPLTIISQATDGEITWTDSNTFTTTDTQWANVQAGDEVEFIQGTGSGYLAHVTSITEATGTYTVNIDEDIKNLTATKTGRAIASRWNKLTTLSSDIISNEDGYSEIAVGVKSKQIQFKIELRGEDVEIEEILVAHQLHKPVA